SSLSEPLAGTLVLRPGTVLSQQIDVSGGMRAADLNFDAVRATAPGGAIELELIRPETAEVLWTRRLTAGELTALPKVYVPTGRYAGDGDALLLKIRSRHVLAEMPRGASGAFGWGRSVSPVILSAVFPDGRLFENLDALPRFFPVWRVREIPFATMLANKAIDFRREAIVTDARSGARRALFSASESVPEVNRTAFLRVRQYDGARAVVDAQSSVPYLLASSEKLTPELAVTIDGRAVEPLEINGIFAGVPVDAGTHRIVFTRRIGRGWWPVFFGGVLTAGLAILVDRRVRRSSSRA
ncbi:MAG TPA: hypothetical protein VGE86_02665, partial [Thermoanaerobaculia bacterium]